MKNESLIFPILLLLCALMFLGAVHAGETYLHLNVEPDGDIDKGARAVWDGVYENQNGAMAENTVPITRYGSGGLDALVLKLASDGKIQWHKTYGGAADDFGRLLAHAVDGGYVVGGVTHSFGAGSPNAWLATIGKDGNVPGCPAVGAPSSNVRGTQATLQNTSVTGKNTAAAPKASQAKSAAASSTVRRSALKANEG